MEITPLAFEGSWLAQSPIWNDDRGFFREWFKSSHAQMATGYEFNVQQANISKSSAGTIRGIHYSVASHGQAKWITCVTGSIKDFIIDIRPTSSTFGKWVTVELNAISGKSVLIGPDLGHAFVSLENNTTVAYLVSSIYSPEKEMGINPLDPEIGINWGVEVSDMKISDKDRFSPTLKQLLLENKLPKQSTDVSPFI